MKTKKKKKEHLLVDTVETVNWTYCCLAVKHQKCLFVL